MASSGAFWNFTNIKTFQRDILVIGNITLCFVGGSDEGKRISLLLGNSQIQEENKYNGLGSVIASPFPIIWKENQKTTFST